MDKYKSNAYLSHNGKIVKPGESVELTPEQAIRLGDKVEAVSQDKKPITLADLTVNELKDIAEDKGLTGYAKLKKEDIINLIEVGE